MSDKPQLVIFVVQGNIRIPIVNPQALIMLGHDIGKIAEHLGNLTNMFDYGASREDIGAAVKAAFSDFYDIDLRWSKPVPEKKYVIGVTKADGEYGIIFGPHPSLDEVKKCHPAFPNSVLLELVDTDDPRVIASWDERGSRWTFFNMDDDVKG